MFYLTSSRHNSYQSLFNFVTNPSGKALQYMDRLEYVLHLESLQEKSLRVVTNNNPDLGIQFSTQDPLLKALREVVSAQGRELLIEN